MSGRRYPFDRLVTAAGLSEAALGRAVGLSGSTLKKAREWGLTESAADRYATRAGFHPGEVWPDFGLIPCAECGSLFAPTRARHWFCTKSCRNRQYQRARYQGDPEHAERKRASNRAYYEQCGDYVRAQMRRRYHQRSVA